MRIFRLPMFVMLLTSLFVLSACNSNPSKVSASPAAVPEKKEPVLYTARPCLERMWNQAARWQSDALPFNVESESNEEAIGQDGRSSVWRARFSSASAGKTKTYACSGSRLRESPPLGVTGDREIPYSPGLIVMTFAPERMVVDSGNVAELVQKHATAEYIKKDAKQPMVYQLGVDPKSEKLIWLAVLGKSQNDSKIIYIVDATQQKFLGSFKR